MKTTIAQTADAVRPLKPELEDESYTVAYEWIPEGDGFTLYRISNKARMQNCGRLNTGASVSTHALATLYNSAVSLSRERDTLRGIATGATLKCVGMELQRNALRDALKRLRAATDEFYRKEPSPETVGDKCAEMVLADEQARAALALCKRRVDGRQERDTRRQRTAMPVGS